MILNDSECAPDEVRLEHSFVSGPGLRIGCDVRGWIESNWFVGFAYTPPMFRRRRLARWAPLARRALAMRAYWQWIGREQAHLGGGR